MSDQTETPAPTDTDVSPVITTPTDHEPETTPVVDTPVDHSVDDGTQPVPETSNAVDPGDQTDTPPIPDTADITSPAPESSDVPLNTAGEGLTAEEEQAAPPSISDPTPSVGYNGPTLEEIDDAREARDEHLNEGSVDPIYTATEATTYEKIAYAVGLGYPGVLQLATLNENQVTALVNEGDKVRLPAEFTYVGIDNVTTGD